MKRTHLKLLFPPLYFFFAFALMLSLSAAAWGAAKVVPLVTADHTELTPGDQPQTVTVTVAPSQTVLICDYGFSVELPEGWSIASIQNRDPNAKLTAADYNTETGAVAWMTGDMESVSVSSFADIAVLVPAGTPEGTYTIRISGLCADGDYTATSVMRNAAAEITVTVGGGSTAPRGDTGSSSVPRGDTGQENTPPRIDMKPIAHTPPQFTDTEGHWARSAIDYMAGQGLMEGVAPALFRPEGKVTRGMLVTILYRMEGSPAVSSPSPFTDVPRGQWYTQAVIWAAEKGIVTGVGGGRFAPDDNISRQQLAAILMRCRGAQGGDTSARADLTRYGDSARIADWARDAMAWANSLGLLTGRTATEIAPEGTATRAECAAILMRYCTLSEAN